jgi:hypothetical protein
MSDQFALPDASTPFRSSDEERFHFSHPRYAREQAYRSAVEAKLYLGNDYSPPVQPRSGGVTRVGADGVATSHSALRITFSDTDTANEQEAVRLRSEINDMKKQIAADDRDAISRGETPKEGSHTPYPSQNCPELIADMGHPLYRANSKEGEAFREHVMRRLSVTQ